MTDSAATTGQQLSLSVDELSALLRAAPVDFALPANELRPAFAAALAAAPPPADLVVTQEFLGGVEIVRTARPGADRDGAVFYLHGGGYAAGSAWDYQAVSGALAGAAGCTAVSVDYRLAPESTFPAALDDALAAYAALVDEFDAHRVAVAGDSAGGGLAIDMLLAAREAGLPAPGCAVLWSPWLDLSCAAESHFSRAAADPSLTSEGLLVRAADYVSGGTAPIPLDERDLRGLPPLLIQAGSAEILLDDAVDLAGRAATADVHVELQIWPRMPHVFPSFAGVLPEARAALERAGEFIACRTR